MMRNVDEIKTTTVPDVPYTPPKGGYRADEIVGRFVPIGSIPSTFVPSLALAATHAKAAKKGTSRQRNSYCLCGKTDEFGRRLKGKDCCYAE